MKKVLLIIASLIVIILVGAVIWLSTLDGKYDVSRKIVINANEEKVFNEPLNFRNWGEWSPWMVAEPDAKITFSGKNKELGAIYKWEGDIVGKGEIEHTLIKPYKTIEQEIRFEKPFKSVAKTYWNFEKQNDSSIEVTLGMRGEMPFFFRFMTKQMSIYIGMDYERGLSMLKDYIETGEVASNVEIVGEVEVKPMKYVASKTSCSFDELKEVMGKDLNNLFTYITNNNVSTVGAPMTVYHEYDFENRRCEYSTAIAITDTHTPTGNYYVASMPKTKAFKVIFKGHYKHIGNAWAAGMQIIMHTKGMKESKDIPPYEMYLTNPHAVPNPKDWVTEIYLPLK